LPILAKTVEVGLSFSLGVAAAVVVGGLANIAAVFSQTSQLGSMP
jgi:hypothetical protein